MSLESEAPCQSEAPTCMARIGRRRVVRGSSCSAPGPGPVSPRSITCSSSARLRRPVAHVPFRAYQLDAAGRTRDESRTEHKWPATSGRSQAGGCLRTGGRLGGRRRRASGSSCPPRRFCTDACSRITTDAVRSSSCGRSSVPVCWDVVTAIALAVEGSVGDDGDGSGWVVEEMIDDVS